MTPKNRPCPECGGTDRFHIVPVPTAGGDPFWRCRQCPYKEYDRDGQPSGVKYRGTSITLADAEKPATNAPTKAPNPVYKNLAAYAQAHGVGVEVFVATGWTDCTHWKRPALRFTTETAPRYRFLDGLNPKYAHAGGTHKGDARVWYKLPEALALSEQAACLALCNGEASTVVAQHYGVPALAPAGGGEHNLPTHLLTQLQAAWTGPIIVALDGDGKGRTAAPKLVEQLCAAGYDAHAVDLGPDFDLANFCHLHQADALNRLVSLPSMTEASGTTDTGTPATPSRATVVALMPDILSARDLLNKPFAPIRWVVPGILHEGCYILAGAPKLGKSGLALALSIAVASGGIALGVRPVAQGDVLYCDLENGQRRVKDRLESSLMGEQAPAGLFFATEWPQANVGGTLLLDEYLTAHPTIKMVVIDTLQRIRPPGNKADTPYAQDYGAIAPWQALAVKHCICIILIHHTRKQGDADFINLISGSTGLTAGADGLMVMARERGKADATLFITSRDTGEQELALKSEWPLWTLLGDAAEVRRSDKQLRVIVAISSGATTVKDIYEAVLVDEEGLKLPALRVRLSDMVKSGIIANGQQGQYALVAAPPKSKRNLIELTELTELTELIELTPHEDAACKADYKAYKVYAAAEPYTPALHSNGLNPERISSISSISSSAPNAALATLTIAPDFSWAELDACIIEAQQVQTVQAWQRCNELVARLSDDRYSDAYCAAHDKIGAARRNA